MKIGGKLTNFDLKFLGTSISHCTYTNNFPIFISSKNCSDASKRLYGKCFSDTLFNSIGWFVQSPPFTLPHFNNLETFFLYIVSSQCIEVSLLATTLNIFFSERKTQLLTGREVVKAIPGFKHSVAMRTKPINTETVIFLLSACCKESFTLTFWSCSLEIGHDHIFKAEGLVLSRCESTCF